jgi:hypothetical protein
MTIAALTTGSLTAAIAQLDRLLDPEKDKVQLDTVQRAAAAVGRTLHLCILS